MTDVQQHLGAIDPDPQPEQRVRKRRRRTMACTQCRSRKLRCDREYPVCGRCQKGKSPSSCTYEDGFLWQQPNTVASPAFSDRGSTAMAQLPRIDRTSAAQPTPDSGISSLPSRPFPTASHRKPGEEKRDRFLETVLGAPKAAVNQEPYVNTEVLQRPRPSSENRRAFASRSLDENDSPPSPSQQLDLMPRIMMRGKETKTRFNGSGIFANLIAQVAYCPLFLCLNAVARILTGRTVSGYQVVCGRDPSSQSSAVSAATRSVAGGERSVEEEAP